MLVPVAAVVVVLPLLPDLRKTNFNLRGIRTAEYGVPGIWRCRRQYRIIILSRYIIIHAQYFFHHHPLIHPQAIYYKEKDGGIPLQLRDQIPLDDVDREGGALFLFEPVPVI